ncbi:serine protease Do [Natronocella acetinitrilica]|jgi:hypothetical protein|uniref:Serine protease Do n=1 Tax=Natronocella acetinitrilica TaxID=414046 RepID=A0AAE3G5X6_9GAMM|nr:hypothetical protein [Natronocella acetinitrilica]MCP1675992.1 serine protease Do [Natronocella acetinitrilica]
MRGMFPALMLLGLFVIPTSAVTGDSDWQSEPHFGSIDLEAGFSPDPHEVIVRAGGTDEVDSRLAPDCAGYVDMARPDVDLNFEPGSMSLFIYVRSEADTSLVIYGPDGRWYCNDDFMGVDPMVVFHNPLPGSYHIWVGTWDVDAMGAEATLNISEINPVR